MEVVRGWGRGRRDEGEEGLIEKEGEGRGEGREVERGGGLPCLEGGGTKSFGSEIFLFYSPPASP